MKKKKKAFSVKTKMHLFVMLTVLIVALGISACTFYTSADQINKYYKQCAADNARNFASFVDGDFLSELRKTVEADEYQELRKKAEEEENEDIIKDYFIKHGLWEKYKETQKAIEVYLENMSDIKYLYIVVPGDKDALQDMYLVDTSDEPVYETGYYEDREAELLGIDIEHLKEPVISNGTWGWLCSAFSPVYSSDGQSVCVIGCDFGMNDVMNERMQFLLYLCIGALVFTVAVQFLAIFFINKMVVAPLDAMTNEMKKFKPDKNLTYEEAGVIDLPITRDDEIGAIYNGIRSMQTNIIDHLNDLSALQEDKLKAEQDIKDKEKQIDQLNEENNTDVLTGVGSKSAYARKVDELNRDFVDGTVEFAIVMVDMNNLKQINDKYGHKVGDQYIRGCCHMICDEYSSSQVYRIGGDEFVVVVQGSDYKNRKEIFNKLWDAFESSFRQEDKKPWLRYSAAIGMAENAAGDTTVDLVFRRADKAMYKDKKRFKNLYGSYR